MGSSIARSRERRINLECESGNGLPAQKTDEMNRHYRVLVIGGGVVGCNVLWHLTREGWSDVALCERRELTAGATWHSSGHVSAYTGDVTLVEFARYTRSQIDGLRTEVEQDLGLRSTGPTSRSTGGLPTRRSLSASKRG